MGIDDGLRRNVEAEAARVRHPAHPEKWRRKRASGARASRVNPARTGNSGGRPVETSDAHARLASCANGVPSSAEQRTTTRRRDGRARDVRRSHADAEARS